MTDAKRQFNEARKDESIKYIAHIGNKISSELTKILLQEIEEFKDDRNLDLIVLGCLAKFQFITLKGLQNVIGMPIEEGKRREEVMFKQFLDNLT